MVEEATTAMQYHTMQHATHYMSHVVSVTNGGGGLHMSHQTKSQLMQTAIVLAMVDEALQSQHATDSASQYKRIVLDGCKPIPHDSF